MEKIVPRGTITENTIRKLEIYRENLLKWQKAVNLVSPNTLDDAWNRHFIDSAQISAFLPENAKTLLDFGSGAGFPGLVLAIMHPELEVHLVESDMKKCQFLKNVLREVSTVEHNPAIVPRGTIATANIHNCRIETFEEDITPDIITARALADLKTLFSYALPYAEKNPALTLLLPKGENADIEISEAETQFSFEVISHPSVTHDKAQILEIRQLKSL